MREHRFVWFLTAMIWAAAPLPADDPDALEAYRLGEYREAVAITRAEIEENPANRDAYTVLGWSLMALGRYEEAADSAQEALEFAPVDHRLLHIRATSLYRLERFREALQYLERYAETAPDGRFIADVYYMMGQVFLSFGEYYNADMALTAAVDHRPTNAEWWVEVGTARELAGDESAAEEAYRNALDIDPDSREAERSLERLVDGL